MPLNKKTQLIKTVKDFEQLRLDVDNDIAFVPTMGALHDGHLSLVKKAQQLAKIVIVSIFVNPLQFSANEDLDKYPRSFAADFQKLESAGVDFLFMPELKDIYPEDKTVNLIKAKAELADCLCGLSRAGHFDGVCTIVKLLFDLVKPRYAVFGEKDYQQLMIIKNMVADYKLDIDIIPGEIIRESKGLAMSSRNQYLSVEEFDKAALIYKTLNEVSQGLSIEKAKANLMQNGFELDYLEIKWDRVFVAVKLGSTRLIDNVPMVKN